MREQWVTSAVRLVSTNRQFLPVYEKTFTFLLDNDGNLNEDWSKLSPNTKTFVQIPEELTLLEVGRK